MLQTLREDDDDESEEDNLSESNSLQISLEKAEVLERLQQRLHQLLEELPPLDSSGFWVMLEKPGQLLKPEVFAWAVGQFARQGDQEKTERAFAALYLRTKRLAFHLAF